jgi:hypothetical protein
MNRIFTFFNKWNFVSSKGYSKSISAQLKIIQLSTKWNEKKLLNYVIQPWAIRDLSNLPIEDVNLWKYWRETKWHPEILCLTFSSSELYDLLNYEIESNHFWILNRWFIFNHLDINHKSGPKSLLDQIWILQNVLSISTMMINFIIPNESWFNDLYLCMKFSSRNTWLILNSISCVFVALSEWRELLLNRIHCSGRY